MRPKGNDNQLKHSSFDFYLALTAAVIGIAAMMVYPSFNLALGRGKQKRNMAEMRAIGTAVEAYYVDNKAYPVGKSVSAIREQLEGIYITELPTKDRWGNYYLYQSDGLESYTITSFGKDHKLDGSSVYRGVITRFTNDVVFSNGSFISFPDGT